MSKEREKTKELLSYYLKNPGRFSILIFGERGTGKSMSVKNITKTMNVHDENFIEISCASFSDDKIAESELFGVKKGMFTGVDERSGVFEKAKNGILFFDEIHTLSKRVQEKLMITLQTENQGKHKGEFSYYVVGETKKKYSNARVVFATNKTVDKLKEYLLPDFYDRIAQLIVKFPSLTETPETIEDDFKEVWQKMKFKEYYEIPALKAFYKWLKRIKLPGNYRDLEKIAILWHQGRIMDIKKEEQIFEWVKTLLETYHSDNNILNSINYNFRKGVTKKEMEKEYRNEMYKWAIEIFENKKEAEKALDFRRLNNLKK